MTRNEALKELQGWAADFQMQTKYPNLSRVEFTKERLQHISGRLGSIAEALSESESSEPSVGDMWVGTTDNFRWNGVRWEPMREGPYRQENYCAKHRSYPGSWGKCPMCSIDALWGQVERVKAEMYRLGELSSKRRTQLQHHDKRLSELEEKDKWFRMTPKDLEGPDAETVEYVERFKRQMKMKLLIELWGKGIDKMQETVMDEKFRYLMVDHMGVFTREELDEIGGPDTAERMADTNKEFMRKTEEFLRSMGVERDG